MIAEVILGENIDTIYWIKLLKLNLHENIIVVDYDSNIEPKMIDGVTYLSHIEAKEFLKKFDSINYYKSLYIYPGIYKSKSAMKADEKNKEN